MIYFQIYWVVCAIYLIYQAWKECKGSESFSLQELILIIFVLALSFIFAPVYFMQESKDIIIWRKK